MIARTIVSKAATILSDAGNIHWTASEMLGWVNSGMKEIVILKPDALTQNSTVDLVAGTKQAIPATGICLLDVIRNYGPKASPAPGAAISRVSRHVLDSALPDWHIDRANATVKNFVFDVRDPKHFYVYPPQPVATTQTVEAVISVAPTEAVTDAATLDLDDIYENVLLDYVLYRAFGKNATGTPERSAAHYQAFVGALTGKTQATGALTPQPAQSTVQK